MSHFHPPSDPQDTILLSDLSPETQARVRALIRPPVKPLASTPGPSQWNLSGSELAQLQVQQTQPNHAPISRENPPSFPLTEFSFELPRPSFPWMHTAPAPLAAAITHAVVTHAAPTSNLPTPPLPAFQLPAITALRPLPSEQSGSVVPSVVQKRKTGLKSGSSYVKKKKKGLEGQAIEVEESARDSDDHTGDELTALIRDLKSDLASFRVDLPTPFVVTAEGEAKGDLALVIRSLGQLMTDQMALVRGGLLLLATRVSAMEEPLKNSRKVPRGERSDQENEAYKYMKVHTFNQFKLASSWLPQSEIHTTVQSLLHWKPSDGFAALPHEGDKYQDNDSGNEVEISAPHWDERIDTASNVIWMANVTTLIEGNVKVSNKYTFMT